MGVEKVRWGREGLAEGSSSSSRGISCGAMLSSSDYGNVYKITEFHSNIIVVILTSEIETHTLRNFQCPICLKLSYILVVWK